MGLLRGAPDRQRRPGSHHVLSRVFKDLFPRYKTMRGHRVERKAGWDSHGLPVEIAVEQRARHSPRKAEIEEYGIEQFNAKCRESVFEYPKEWNRLTERVGFWVDLDDAYRTLDESYIESVWWALAELYKQGPALRGAQGRAVLHTLRHRALLARGRARLSGRGRPLGLRAPSAGRPGADPLQEGDALLIWTTTPWTLPGNVAVAVGPDIEYVRARHSDGKVYVLAAALVERVLGEQAEILDRFPGRELLGASYEGPIFATGPAGGFPIVAGDFVTTRRRHRARPHRAGVRRGRLRCARRRRACSTRPTPTRSSTPCDPTAPSIGAYAVATGAPTRGVSSRTRS